MHTLLAGIAGGIAMFIWASIAHVATPLGHVGISTLPNETATIQTFAAALGDHAGLYLFPVPPKTSSTGQAPEGAAGLLVWRPHVKMSLNPANLVTEFGSEIVEALIAALLLGWAAISGYAARVGFVSLVGLAASITTNISYWNWYGFPTNYSLVYSLVQLVGYVVAGLVIAAIIAKPAAR